jgi:hypothetical protein
MTTARAVCRVAIGGLAALLLGGCIDVPGTTEGGPCNSKGVCTKGLTCEEGICKAEGTTSWELMRTPTTKTLRGVWGTSATDVIAVGDDGTVLRYTGGTEWHADNSGTSAAAGGDLRSVWGRSGNDIWAVGSPSAGGGGLILHCTGTAWEKQPPVKEPGKTTDMAISSLSSVAGATGTPLYVVGTSTVTGYTGLVLKLDGAWSVETATGLTYAGQGVAVVGTQVFVAGTTKAVRFFNGSSWDERALPGSTQVNLYAVYGWDESHVIAGGSAGSGSGKLVRFDGSTWEELSFDSVKTFQVYGVWGASPQDYFVVGEGGGYETATSVLRCGDSGCYSNSVPTEAQGKQLNAVWGTEADVFAVGEAGIVLRRTQ